LKTSFSGNAAISPNVPLVNSIENYFDSDDAVARVEPIIHAIATHGDVTGVHNSLTGAIYTLARNQTVHNAVGLTAKVEALKALIVDATNYGTGGTNGTALKNAIQTAIDNADNAVLIAAEPVLDGLRRANGVAPTPAAIIFGVMDAVAFNAALSAHVGTDGFVNTANLDVFMTNILAEGTLGGAHNDVAASIRVCAKTEAYRRASTLQDKINAVRDEIIKNYPAATLAATNKLAL